MDEPSMTYWPHMWFNEFWLLRDNMVGPGGGGGAGWVVGRHRAVHVVVVGWGCNDGILGAYAVESTF